MPIRPGSKNEHLYKISKHTSKPKVDKSTDELDYEKFKEEYTFSPAILPNASKLAKSRLEKHSKLGLGKGRSPKIRNVDSSSSISQTPVKLAPSQNSQKDISNLRINKKEYSEQNEETPMKSSTPPVPYKEKESRRFSNQDLIPSTEWLKQVFDILFS